MCISAGAMPVLLALTIWRDRSGGKLPLVHEQPADRRAAALSRAIAPNRAAGFNPSPRGPVAACPAENKCDSGRTYASLLVVGGALVNLFCADGSARCRARSRMKPGL
jgi:hypothetical protein